MAKHDKPAVGDNRKRLRAIRRLSRGYPSQTVADRLDKIADIAKGGDIPPRSDHRAIPPEEYLADQQSRSPRTNHTEPPRKRKGKGRDRSEKGGRDRGDE
jgi:hypothetical protein